MVDPQKPSAKPPPVDEEEQEDDEVIEENEEMRQKSLQQLREGEWEHEVLGSARHESFVNPSSNTFECIPLPFIAF